MARRLSDNESSLAALRDADIQTIKVFMHWYLDTHEVRALDTLYVQMRFWRMMYAHRLRVRIDLGVTSQMKNVR